MLTPAQAQIVSRTGTIMALQNFDFPGVTLRQEFAEASTGTTSTLAVACVGPQYNLHRADVATEAAKIPQESTQYDPDSGLTVASLPGRVTDATLDTTPSTQRLVVKNGVFTYTDSLTPTLQANGTIKFPQPVADGGGFTAAAAFGTRGVKVGDPVILDWGTTKVNTEIIGLVSETGKGYNTIVVKELDQPDSATLSKVNFGVYQDATFQAGSDTFSIAANGAMTIQGGLTAPINELSGMEGTLQAGDFYVEYRELTQKYVGKLGSVSSAADVEAVLGGVTAENPLALATYFAAMASKGVTVYFSATRDDSSQSYLDAMDFLEKYTAVYSVVPTTEDKDVILAAAGSVVAVSEDEESKIRRTLWFGNTIPDQVQIWEGKGTPAAVVEENPQVVTMEENVFYEHPFRKGDYLINNADGKAYEIASTDGMSKATLVAGAEIAGTSPLSFRLVRGNPLNEDLIDVIISQRYVSSYRVQCVWADNILFNGEVVPNFAGAAAAAGMRAYEAPHRPLSNLGYVFFSIEEPHGFTRSQLKTIGSNGIWIIANNEDGTPINMKQITTAMQNNVNVDEESIVANADEIALDLVHAGETRVGNSNISPALIAALDMEITTRMESRLRNTSGSAYVGPQLLSWELLNIYQDTVNLDWVWAEIECEPPKPFNKFKMVMRII
jgi:hypothetical protein